MADLEPFRTDDFAFEVAPLWTDFGKRGWVTVQLPHQCDEWVIAGGPPDYVIEHLARFIERAQAVLDDLKAAAGDAK